MTIARRVGLSARMTKSREGKIRCMAFKSTVRKVLGKINRDLREAVKYYFEDFVCKRVCVCVCVPQNS